MYPNPVRNVPALGGGYVPYFYQAGLFELYPGSTQLESPPRTDVVSDSLESRSQSRSFSILTHQTVEEVIARGYFAVPGGDPTTAIISDRQHTSRLGLDDLIGQIKKRYEIFEGNIEQLQWAKCAAVNMIYQHESYSGGGAAGSKQHYAKHKGLRQLYEEERKERIELWRDLSRLRLLLPESAQSYLSSYRKVAALSDLTGESPMITRVQELCRKLQPVLGKKVDGLWRAYLAESDAGGKADIEQTLELLAAKHLGQGFQPDRSPFPPPPQKYASSGDIEVGSVSYGQRELYPFNLQSGRLKEHILVAGRSGSGKTNLTFVLMRGMMNRGINVLALDWKRGYRDLLKLHPELRVYTIGRDVSPFRFNPLIPPPGCEPQVWIKLIVDVIASAYLGGEGVISLLVAGLDHLFREAGVFDKTQTHWPTIHDLLTWLRSVKLKGRAAMWQASAERILLAMTYGEFEGIVNTQSNAHIQELLDHNVVFEMDGLSAASDRVLFSEALTLWLYRYRLAQGPRDQLTNVVVLEEAHNLLHRKASDTRESVLETSIRMTRQFGLGYVFVDQSASLLSQVAFANSYATLALSQKLKADVQTISAAMNLTDEQRDALTTLSIGTAVVRLADEHPEPFLVKIPRCPVREGCVSDQEIRVRMSGYSAKSAANNLSPAQPAAISPVPSPDRNTEIKENPHPPTPEESRKPVSEDHSTTPTPELNHDEIRFLQDVATRPLSTTVSRYQRLHLSRRRGNAIRQQFVSRGLIEPVPIATRSGQVVLYQLTDDGRVVCSAAGIDPGPPSPASLEHQYWVGRVSDHFERKGYTISHEHQVKGNGAVDVLAERPGERVAIEVETGKSDIKGNLSKLRGKGFDRVVVVATSPAAVAVCQKVVDGLKPGSGVELATWLDY